MMSYARDEAIKDVAQALRNKDSAAACKAQWMSHDLLKVSAELSPMADYMAVAERMLDDEVLLVARERLMVRICGG